MLERHGGHSETFRRLPRDQSATSRRLPTDCSENIYRTQAYTHLGVQAVSMWYPGSPQDNLRSPPVQAMFEIFSEVVIKEVIETSTL